MKKIMQIGILIGFVMGFCFMGGGFGNKAAAAGGESRISNIIGKDTFLMDNGTMWSLIDGNRKIRTLGSVSSITGDEYFGIGVTQDGQLIEWSVSTAPRPVVGQTGVKQVAGSFWLKTDGSVWNSAGKVKDLDGISMIGYAERRFAALSRNGDVLLSDRNITDKYLKLGKIENADSVTSLTVIEDHVALLFESGQVVVYETANFDDNGKIIPVTVAQDAIHIAYTSGDPTDVLLVTRKDGTVWQTGEYQARWKLDQQISGLGTVVKTAAYLDSNHFYAQRSDGSWVLFADNVVTSVEIPKVDKVDVSISELKPNVGDILKVSIQETYSNGAKIKVIPNETNISVDKPYLLKLQSDGSLKVLGVGQTQVTLTTGGVTKTLTVSASLQNNLKWAKQVNGIEFVPAKAVIQALGGTVSITSGIFEASIGDVTFSFKVGDMNAQLNGETITLKAAPLTEKGDTYIPGMLLTFAVGASVNWDGKWKTAEISFGDAKMTVVSSDTAGLVKKAMQGSLAKYIGKSYWINYFQQWDRFSKVTVSDILPDDSGDFVIVFKSAAGKELKSFPMSSSFVSELFTNEDYFFNFDPKKKYPWSASTWSLIKAGKIVLGMTKDQVKMSWGYPSGRNVTNASGKTIETWVYYNFDVVSFVNGKVTFILN
ncbi:copper amine oxidase N-terminal domain-containing protein [Cohnella sp. WQ 127256]|uniref:copper amine oxidase N-terminal domain-containing protein n=1 Tax=Cohnella sp. WQ 127256 TaxID=2938790 RepID=UPI0021174827|nr:copper amine oxidase N-terminal domain-containing protein [Cohnella sp. WQ 127256]